MRDPYLAAIIESVQSGGDPVEISVALHSGAVVSGLVRRSHVFASATRNEVRRAHQQASFVGVRSRSSDCQALLRLEHAVEDELAAVLAARKPTSAGRFICPIERSGNDKHVRRRDIAAACVEEPDCCFSSRHLYESRVAHDARSGRDRCAVVVLEAGTDCRSACANACSHRSRYRQPRRSDRCS